MGILAKLILVRKKVRYGRYNLFSGLNRRIDTLAAGESVIDQARVHKSRWAAIGEGYRKLFAGHRANHPKFDSFEHACEFYSITPADITKLQRTRVIQSRMFAGFAAILSLFAIMQMLSHHPILFLVNAAITILFMVLALIFKVESWRLKTRTLGGFREWLRS